MRGRRLAGFTALEVVIYSALSLALLGGVSLYVQNGLRMFRGGENYRTVQSDAMLTLRRLGHELANSTDAADAGGGRIQFGDTPSPYIILPSADDLLTDPDYKIWVYDTNGNLLWRKWTMFSLDPQRRAMVHQELGFAGCTRDALAVASPEDLTSEPVVFGKNITRLTTQWLEPGRVMELSLTAEMPNVTGTHGSTAVELRTNIRVEN